ncbi:hypothetical protein D3C87_1925340 [compost metagenome]
MGAELVVDADDFKFDARRVLFVELFSDELEALELVRSHRGHEARKGVEPGDLHGLALLSERAASAYQQYRGCYSLNSEFHGLVSL